jgi:hypothetical protein
MGILCRLGQHYPSPQMRSNAGVSFSRCRDCGCDLILAASGWRPVPRGYRIVWRSGPPARAANPAQLALALPESPGPPAGALHIARPAAPLPRQRGPRTGRNRAAAEGEGRATA